MSWEQLQVPNHETKNANLWKRTFILCFEGNNVDLIMKKSIKRHYCLITDFFYLNSPNKCVISTNCSLEHILLFLSNDGL